MIGVREVGSWLKASFTTTPEKVAGKVGSVKPQVARFARPLGLRKIRVRPLTRLRDMWIVLVP